MCEANPVLNEHTNKNMQVICIVWLALDFAFIVTKIVAGMGVQAITNVVYFIQIIQMLMKPVNAANNMFFFQVLVFGFFDEFFRVAEIVSLHNQDSFTDERIMMHFYIHMLHCIYCGCGILLSFELQKIFVQHLKNYDNRECETQVNQSYMFENMSSNADAQQNTGQSRGGQTQDEQRSQMVQPGRNQNVPTHNNQNSGGSTTPRGTQSNMGSGTTLGGGGGTNDRRAAQARLINRNNV